MDAFERVGVNYQYSCTTIEECNKMLEYSCNCCTSKSRALWHSCDRCPIVVTHNAVVAIFNDRLKGGENNDQIKA